MAKITEVSFDAQSDEDLGEIKITTGVLESIAVQATSEIEGVVTKPTGFQREVGSFLGMERDRIKAEITSDEDKVVVDIEIKVKYGYSVPEIAMQIQQKVKEQILYMTDLVVSEVNIHILSIETEASNPELNHSESEGEEDLDIEEIVSEQDKTDNSPRNLGDLGE